MKDRSRDFDPLEAVTVRQAAALLNMSRPTVERFIKAGELPSALIGRCRRIRRADLEAFLQERTAYGWRPYEPDARPCVNPATAYPAEGDDVPF